MWIGLDINSDICVSVIERFLLLYVGFDLIFSLILEFLCCVIVIFGNWFWGMDKCWFDFGEVVLWDNCMVLVSLLSKVVVDKCMS